MLNFNGRVFLYDVDSPKPVVRELASLWLPRRFKYLPKYLVESSGELFQVVGLCKGDENLLAQGDDSRNDTETSSEEEDADHGHIVDNDDETSSEEEDEEDESSVDYCSYTSTESDSYSESRYSDNKIVSFWVYKLQTSTMEWMRVTTLDNNTFFVGSNSSFSVSSLGFFGCKRNCIYFTDYPKNSNCNTRTSYSSEGNDNSIVNLNDETIEPVYPVNSMLRLSTPIWVTRIPW
ncbi:hypothetical protein GIB67_038034 [Kingdonia uniflora]|uniref:KIB1-4 beta-propeller domain-containing protein n=1 Tax=Kingdonia uniflora TaxID=39325 RepID=A0A7J7MC00_9MAGN|nr:hypothetical protein GIB67_038034 [Kingdonia uniflora]